MKRFLTAQAILIAILVLASILRLWNLGNVPPSASLDEASIGYNAYSILKTGGDEYGELPILSHRAYDDYRRAIYLYLVIPFVKILGLNVLAVRLPAVILSVLTVLATYFLVKELFRFVHLRGVHSATSEVSTIAFSSTSEVLSLLTAFLLAISPWHIYISRLGHESNAGLAFLVFGVLFFLQGEKNKSWVLILLSMFFFTLSMVSYYSGQVFIPLFVIGLFFLFRKNLLSIVSSDKHSLRSHELKKIIIAFFIFLILVIPILKEIFSPEALVRFQGTSVFKPEVHGERFNQRMELWAGALKNNDIVGTILYSRYLFLSQVFIEGYAAHFNPKWLFTNSGADPHKVPNTGLLYLWEIPLIVIGVVAFLFSRVFDRKVKLLVFLWFFLAALPAAIATQTPHAMRSYNFLPTWQIFAAFGLAYTLYRLKKFRILGLFAFAIVILISLQTLYNNYFIVFPKEQSRSFHYALSKTVPYILSQQEQESYQKVVFSNRDNLYQSYMLFLYHSRYDPSLYQKFGGTRSGGFAETHKIGKFEFRPIDFEKEKEGNLYVGNTSDFPTSTSPVKTFSNLDGQEAIFVVEK